MTKYSRMDQGKFVEGSLLKNWSEWYGLLKRVKCSQQHFQNINWIILFILFVDKEKMGLYVLEDCSAVFRQTQYFLVAFFGDGVGRAFYVLHISINHTTPYPPNSFFTVNDLITKFQIIICGAWGIFPKFRF